MTTLMIVIFVLGYLAIALEHPIKIDKAASALITGVLCWTVYAVFADDLVNIDSIPESIKAASTGLTEHELKVHFVGEQLLHFLGEIASILFFLMGAMTIVELVDAYEGFSIVTEKIQSTNKVKLMWAVSILTFFLSAVLDNLTTSIVMVSLLRKLIKRREDRIFYAGMVVIAANAGGAWSPIGDVTTTMLWIGGQITALNIVKTLLFPSLVCLAVPLLYLTFTMKGNVERPSNIHAGEHLPKNIKPFHQNAMFYAGVGGLLFVPVFKTFTHLPPFMGMLLSLGIVWVISEFFNSKMDEVTRSSTKVVSVLKKIDTPSVLFFLGILVAITSLQSTGVLRQLAESLNVWIGNQFAIGIAIGLLSAIVDNVPLVAAAMKMYALGPFIDGASFPVDHPFWEFLAYCAGTGGSCLIIGSAAGVAVMGMEKIDFIWYLKKISWLALIGYLAGAVVYIFTYPIFAVH
jgi:Na+/H+ antiporter NhaD/arsenite permease-like protein